MNIGYYTYIKLFNQLTYIKFKIRNTYWSSKSLLTFKITYFILSYLRINNAQIIYT